MNQGNRFVPALRRAAAKVEAGKRWSFDVAI